MTPMPPAPENFVETLQGVRGRGGQWWYEVLSLLGAGVPPGITHGAVRS